MSTQAVAAKKAATLKTRKGSIVAPLLLLLLTIVLFVIYALPSEYDALAKKMGLDSSQPATAATILNAVTSDDPEPFQRLWESSGEDLWTYFTATARPLARAFIDQLIIDMKQIVQSGIGTVLTLALYALVPGLAGLIYRRQFLIWFLGAFGVLMLINMSGLFPALGANAAVMPFSGQVLLFLVSQIVLLVLAYRLRRSSAREPRIPTRVYNGGLVALLTLIGVACWQGWGPGTGAPKDGAQAAAGFRDCRDVYCPGLAEIKAGSFQMGSERPVPDLSTSPSHAVNIGALYIGKFEVTFDEWDACAAAKACAEAEDTNGWGRRSRPVEVTFQQANQYAGWLSSKTGKTYRLPSEAEWEYAARAGSTTDYYFGDAQSALPSHAWFADNAGSKTHPVGRLQPNPVGLYDIYGNVPEWTADCVNHGYAGAPADGTAWGTGDCSNRVVRGGTYWGSADQIGSDLRAAASGPTVEVGQTPPPPVAGFRLVREAAGGVPAVAPAGDAMAIAANAYADDVNRSWIWSFLGTGLTGWVFKWEFILVGLPLIYTLLRSAPAWIGKRRKNIVICLDGTSNNPDQVEGGFAAPTNVYKLFRMLKADSKGMFQPGKRFDSSLCKIYGDQQIGLYYAGVGNEFDNDPIRQALGLSMGLGATDVVERAYLDLTRVYRPGDRVFITGFSRGAAISRLLARAIDARGAPESVWTIKLFGKHRTLWRSRKKVPVTVDVLGCWDTVGSLGIAKTIGGINFQQLNLFKDLSVPPSVKQAYHMVALDEQRDSFEPTLMEPDANHPERIVEVWFAGDHANIGGGWATDRLSDVTLDFLLRRISSGYADSEEAAGSEAWGLFLTAWKGDKQEHWERRDNSANIVDPEPLGQISAHFSRLYEYRPRKLPRHAVISDTVFTRMVESMPIYAPQALFNLNDALTDQRQHLDEQIGKLTESKLLSDADLQRMEGYKSKLRLNRFDDYWNGRVLPARAGKFAPPDVALANGGASATQATVAGASPGTTGVPT